MVPAGLMSDRRLNGDDSERGCEIQSSESESTQDWFAMTRQGGQECCEEVSDGDEECKEEGWGGLGGLGWKRTYV
jgi:hypothetical protein